MWNSNDADSEGWGERKVGLVGRMNLFVFSLTVCCMHANISAEAYIVWGASTQGRAPHPPLTGSDGGTNAVGVAPMALTEMLAAYFP